MTHRPARFFSLNHSVSLFARGLRRYATMSEPSTKEGRPKSPKELEKERKKAEKLAKFQAKQAKKASQTVSSDSKKATKVKNADTHVVEFVDQTKPGEKKILVSLDNSALKAYNPKNVECSWYDWWKSQNFHSPALTKDGKVLPAGKFVIPAPPPNVTGALHIGHALTIAIQDALIRYNRMTGKTTLYIPGFDHAGISTQSVVEKMVWNREKKTRHDYGREKFTEIVWEWKETYHERIRKQLEALGASYDWSREAFTMDSQRSAAVYEAFVQLFDRGVIYRAERLVNWCVHLSTTLSNLEVENKEIKGRTELSVPGYDKKVEFGVLTSFAYPVVGSDEKLVVATTRPETIFGDTAVAVHPEDPRYTHLHGKMVMHPLLNREIPIILDEVAVDMEFGTGAVKITPAHDPNDYETGKRHGLDSINILNDDGTLNSSAGPYAGMKRFDARVQVIEDLKAKGLFIGQTENEMNLPVCSKSGDIIEPILKPQWWVKQKHQADRAIKAVESGKITITPRSSQNEFFHWMRNIQDWCISRQLWWGHQCPAYLVSIEGEPEPDRSRTENWVAGRSEEEAYRKASKMHPGKNIKLVRDEDVLDTWFSSGLWPLSTLGWPNVNSSDFKNFYPMSLLETGWDILFFWVARMIMLSLELADEIPFTEVFCHSLVRDAQGRKMSKSLGNVVDPLDVIAGISLDGLKDKLFLGNLDPREVKKAEAGQKLSFPNGIPQCGADALRFALCAYTTGGRDINLDIYRVEGYRKFCNKIYQATKFALMRLGPDYKPPAGPGPTGRETLVEKWILSKYANAASQLAQHLDNRRFLEATSTIYNFWLYELCDVYIENSKTLILEGTPEECKSAQDTLYTCLEGALCLIHPFMPFITEELWQRLPRRDQFPQRIQSIVQMPWPHIEAYEPKAERDYNLVLDVVKQTRSLLAQYGILKNADVIISADSDSDALRTISEQQSSILTLVKAATSLNITTKIATPEGAVVGVVNPECRVFVVVKGHVNFDEELVKARSKLAKIEQLRKQLAQQTEGAEYIAKVKESVREQNAKKLKAYDAELESLNAVIIEFERLKL